MEILGTLFLRACYIVFMLFALVFVIIFSAFPIHYMITHPYQILYWLLGFVVLFILYMGIGLYLDSKPKKKTKAKAKPRVRKVK